MYRWPQLIPLQLSGKKLAEGNNNVSFENVLRTYVLKKAVFYKIILFSLFKLFWNSRTYEENG